MADGLLDRLRSEGWARKLLVIVLVVMMLLAGAGMLIEGLY